VAWCSLSDLTGGLKKPRELTWVSGALLSSLALSFGVSGYSLPWDEIGFWARQVVSAVRETTDDFLPGVGSSIVCPIRGGFSIGQETLNRAFVSPVSANGCQCFHVTCCWLSNTFDMEAGLCVVMLAFRGQHMLTGVAIVSLLHFLLIRKQSVSGPLWRCW
jgi:hypothetical protein